MGEDRINKIIELDHPLLAELVSIYKNKGYTEALHYLNKWHIRKADVKERLWKIAGKYIEFLNEPNTSLDSDEFEKVIGKIADFINNDLEV